MKRLLIAGALVAAAAVPVPANAGVVREILERLNLPTWTCEKVDHDDNPATRKRTVCTRD